MYWWRLCDALRIPSVICGTFRTKRTTRAYVNGIGINHLRFVCTPNCLFCCRALHAFTHAHVLARVAR